MELGSATRGQVSAFVGYYTMAHASFIGASQPVVIEAASMILSADVMVTNSLSGGVRANNLAGANTTIILGDQFSHVTRGSSAGGPQPGDVIESIDETQTATAAFTQDFWVGVEVDAGGNLRNSGASFDVDFSHTIEFVDLRFYDSAGVDVTQFYRVTFDDPEFYMRSLTPVPEPGSYAMLLAGLGLLVFAARIRSARSLVAG